MGNIVIDIINFLIKGLATIFNLVISLLPPSPFKLLSLNDTVQHWLGYLNWIFPIDSFIAIGEAWLISIGIFYIYSYVMRWIKAIE